MSIQKLSLLGMLTSAAVVGRIAIHGVNVQPATYLIILTGFFFGWKMGLAEGVLVAIVSDLVLGLGIWTIFQALAWGLIGFVSGLLYPSKPAFFIWVVISGYAFGFLMMPTYFMYTNNLQAVFYMYLAGIPFDTYHAMGNLLFSLLSPILFIIFDKQRQKLNN